MITQETTKVGKRGTVVLPVALRNQLGLNEGSLILIEKKGTGILIRPAIVIPLEQYSPERKAEFLLSNAVNKEDYKKAVKEFKAMGLDPEKISHCKPF